MNEQTVTDKPDPAAQQAGEGTGEQDNMDALLASYDENKAPAEPAAQTDDIKTFAAEFRQDRQERLREQIDATFEASAKKISEQIDLPMTDDFKLEMARGLLMAKAEGDPRVTQAFNNSKKDEKTWNAVLDNIAQSVNSGKLDKEATSSRKAMVNSMTGGTTETPGDDDDNGKTEAKRLRKLSDSELYAEVGLTSGI